MTKFKTYYLYFTVFVTGAAVLIIEILGTRILAPFYGSTIFVWSSLLSVALGFLSLGYWVGGVWVDKKPHFTNLYSIVFLAGITITLAVKTSQPILVLSDRFGLQLGPLAASLLLFSVPLFFLGMVTPFAIRLRTHLIEKVGLRSGSIFAIATIGSLVGALLSGFVLIPLMPISIIFFVSSAVLVIVSTAGWILTREKKSIAHIVLAVILVYITIFMPASKSRTPQTKTILLHENTFYGDIKIIGSETQKCLFVNGGSQSCIKLQEPQEPVALFVMQAKELMQALPENSRVLLLGLGGGAIVAAAPEHVTIDSVEIDPRIAELAQTVFNVYPDSQRTVIVDDARRFIRKAASGSYDLIIEDIALGSSIPYYIFSKESLTDMQRILKPKGVVAAHIGVSMNGERDFFIESLVKTSEVVFENVDVYSSGSDRLSNLVMYLYDKESKLAQTVSFYHQYFDVDTADVLVTTDDFNLLDGYYLPHAITERKNAVNAGYQMVFTK